MRSAGWVAIAVSALAFQLAGSAQSSPPLPDPKPFFDAVRRNLARADDVQDVYAYKERRTDLNLNPFGRLGTGSTRVIAVTPTSDGGLNRQVVELDGQPVPNSPIVRRDHRPSSTRGRSMVDDVAAALDVTIDRRDMLNGRPAIVVRFHGKADANPTTREGRIARAFHGFIWIDEDAREVVKVDASAVDDISFGYGLLARVNGGSTVLVLRQQIDGDVWLPTSVRFTGEGRALLIRKLTINFAVDWFDYRKTP
jgi:hypothetical protein